MIQDNNNPKSIKNVLCFEYGEIIICPFCKSKSSSQHIFEVYKWVTLNIFICDNCRHIFSNLRLIRESLAKHYSSQYLKNHSVMLAKSKDDIFKEDSLWFEKMKGYSSSGRGGNHYHFFNHDFLMKELTDKYFNILNSFSSTVFSTHIDIVQNLLNNTKELDEIDKIMKVNSYILFYNQAITRTIHEG